MIQICRSIKNLELRHVLSLGKQKEKRHPSSVTILSIGDIVFSSFLSIPALLLLVISVNLQIASKDMNFIVSMIKPLIVLCGTQDVVNTKRSLTFPKLHRAGSRSSSSSFQLSSIIFQIMHFPFTVHLSCQKKNGVQWQIDRESGCYQSEQSHFYIYMITLCTSHSILHWLVANDGTGFLIGELFLFKMFTA